MTDELIRSAPESSVTADGRTVELRIMPWDTEADTPDGREVFRRGAFAGANAERVTIESGRHGGPLVGRGLTVEERDDAAYLTGRISATPAGDELLTLVADGVLNAASIVFTDRTKPRRSRAGTTERTAVDLRRVAILERGSYPGAGVVAIREESGMTDTAEQERGAPEPEPAPPVIVDLAPLAARIERVESRVGSWETLGVGTGAPAHYRAESLGELLFAAWDEPELKRALVDQITTENAGIIPKATEATVRGIVDLGRRTINAFGGGRPLPPKGMSTTWPKLTTPLTGLYGVQATEKAAIISAKVSFGEGSSPIATYAGGSDVSYQLIRRSEPPYLEQYARVLLAAWARVTNASFVAAVTTAATGTELYVPAGDTDGSKFVKALVGASLDVEAATGLPAEFAILASDLFAAVAGVFALKSVNPSSVAGTATAAGLTVNVSGIDVIHEPAMTAGTGFVSNSLAAAWLEDPVGAPNQIAVDDVERLGSNLAYWNMGSAAVYIPGGIVEFTAV